MESDLGTMGGGREMDETSLNLTMQIDDLEMFENDNPAHTNADDLKVRPFSPEPVPNDPQPSLSTLYELDGIWELRNPQLDDRQSIETLLDQVQGLTAQVEILQIKDRNWTTFIERYKDGTDIGTLKIEKAVLQLNNSLLERDITCLQKHLSHKEDEINSITVENTELKLDISLLKEDKTFSNAVEKEKLRKENSVLKTVNASLKLDVSRLDEEKQNYSDENDELRRKNFLLENENAKFKDDILEKDATITSTLIDAADLKLENDALTVENTELDEAHNVLATKNAELLDSIARKDFDINLFAGENRTLKEESAEKDRQIQLLKSIQDELFASPQGSPNKHWPVCNTEEVEVLFQIKKIENPEVFVEAAPHPIVASSAQVTSPSGSHDNLTLSVNFAREMVADSFQENIQSSGNNSANSSGGNFLNSEMKDLGDGLNSKGQNHLNHDNEEKSAQSFTTTVVETHEVVESRRNPIASSSKKINKKGGAKKKKMSRRKVIKGYWKWTDDRNIAMLNVMIDIVIHYSILWKEKDILPFVRQLCEFDCDEGKIRHQINNLLGRVYLKEIKSDPEIYLAMLLYVRNELLKPRESTN